MVNRQGDGINFLERAALYGLLGMMSRRKGDDVVGLAIGIPVIEKLAGVTLKEALAAAAQRLEELERQQRLEQIRAAIQRAIKPTPVEPVASSPNMGLLVPSEVTMTMEPDARWRQVIVHPSVVLVPASVAAASPPWATAFWSSSAMVPGLTWWASPGQPEASCLTG